MPKPESTFANRRSAPFLRLPRYETLEERALLSIDAVATDATGWTLDWIITDDYAVLAERRALGPYDAGDQAAIDAAVAYNATPAPLQGVFASLQRYDLAFEAPTPMGAPAGAPPDPTTVVSTAPLPNENSIALNVDVNNDPTWPTVSATIDEPIATAPIESIYAYSSHRGVLYDTPTLDGPQTTASIDLSANHPTADARLFAGEKLTTVVTDTVEDVYGTSVEPISWQFTMGVDAASPGEFPQGLSIVAADTLASSHGVLADIDCDGDLDFIDAPSSGAESVTLYENDPTGRFSSWQTIGSAATSGPVVVVGDVNNDMWIDVIVGRSDNRNILYLHTGNPAVPYAAGTPIATAGTGDYHTQALELVDIDNDGDLDLIEANGLTNGSGAAQPNQVYLYDSGTALFDDPVSLGISSVNSTDLAVADFNNDGWLDIAVANNSFTTSNLIHYNIPGAVPNAWIGVDITADKQSSYSIAAADLDNDRFPDIVVGNEGAGGVINRVYENDGAGFFVSGANLGAVADRTFGIRCADVDGDGYQDVLVGNYNEANRLYINQGLPAITFDAGTDLAGDSYRTQGIVLGDIDNDNDIDLITLDQNEANHSYLNTLRPVINTMNTTTAKIVDADTGAGNFTITVEFDQDMDTSLLPSLTFTQDVLGTDKTLSDPVRTWQSSRDFEIVYDVNDNGQSIDDVDFTIDGARNIQYITMLPRVFNDAFSIRMQNPVVSTVTPTTNLSGGAAVTMVNLDVVTTATTFDLSIEFNEPMNTAVAPSVAFDSTGNPGLTMTAPSGVWSDNQHYDMTYTINPTPAHRIIDIGVQVANARNQDGNLQVGSITGAVFSIDTVRPQATGITVSSTILSSVDAGANAFAVTVEYSKSMDTDLGLAPVVTFDSGGVDLSATLAFNHGEWTSQTDYVAWFDVADDGKSVTGVTPLVSGGVDASGNDTNPVQPPSVQTFNVDMTPPTVTSLTPQYQWVGLDDATFYVDIAFDKMMFGAPTVVTLSPNVSSFISYDWLSSGYIDSQTYRAVLDVTSPPASTILAADITMTVTGAEDIRGNVQTAYAASPGFGFDGETPSVTTMTASLAEITTNEQGGQFTLELTYDEIMDPTSTPTLAFNFPQVTDVLQFSSGAWDDPVSPTIYTFTYDITAANHDLGLITVTVDDAEDRARNPQQTYIAADLFEIDTLRPTVTSVGVNDTLLEPGDVGIQTFVVTVMYDKIMDPLVAPTIDFSPDVSSTLSFNVGLWLPGNFIYEAYFDVVDDQQYIEDIDILVSDAIDDIGNTQTAHTETDVFTIEMRGPIVATIEPATPGGPFNTWVNLSRVGTWYPIAITFDKVMNTSVDPTVTLSANVAGNMTYAPASSTWSVDMRTFYAYFDVTLNATEIDPSAITVDVDGAFDSKAGPQIPFSGADIFGFDMIAPQVVPGSITAVPALVLDADVGSPFQLTVEYDETMDPATTPSFTFNGSPNPLAVLQYNGPASAWEASDTRFVARYQIMDVDLEGGPYDVDVDGATDVAGNPQIADSAAAVFSIDTAEPVVTQVTPTPATVTEDTLGDDAFHVTIDFSTAMNAGIDPTIDFGALTPSVLNILTYDAGSSGWTDADTFEAVYDVADRNASILNIPIVISGCEDPNGNVMDPHTEVDAFDMVIDSLYVTSLSVSQSTVAQPDFGGTLTVQWTYNKAMDTLLAPAIAMTPPVADVLAPSATPGVWLDPYIYEAYYDINTVYERLAVVTLDITGGASALGDTPQPYTSVGAITIDTTSPVPLALNSSPDPVNSGDIGGLFALTFTFDEDMDMGVDPSVTFPTEDPSATLSVLSAEWTTARSYRVRYNVLPGDNVLPDVDVQINGLRDTLGNTQQAPTLYADQFSIDTTRPHITSFVLSDDYIDEDDVGNLVTITMTFDKMMDASNDPTITFSDADVHSALNFQGGAWQAPAFQTYVATYRVVRVRAHADDAGIFVTNALDPSGNDVNPSPYTAPVTISVDMTPLEIESIGVTATDITRDMLGQTFDITAEFSRDADTAVLPTVTLTPASANAVLIPQSTTWLDARTLRIRYTISPASPDVDTSVNVAIDGAITPEARPQIPYTATSLFAIDLVAPTVLSVSPSPNVVNTTDVGGNGFALYVNFDEPMDTSVTPTVTFPTEDPMGVLTLSMWAWTSPTQFRAVYDVADVRLTIPNVDVQIDGAVDANGNAMAGPATFADAFDIDLIRPEVTNVVLSHEAITNEMIGADAFWIRVTFDRTMDMGVAPAFSFSSAAANDVLQFNNPQSGWINATTYEIHYNVLNTPADADDVTVTIVQAEGVNGNPQVPYASLKTFNVKITAAPEVAFTSPDIFHFSTGIGGTFTLNIGFNHQMDTGVTPTVQLDPSVSLPLSVVSAGWDPIDATLYSVTYSLPAQAAPTAVTVPFEVTGARSALGIDMTPYEDGEFRVVISQAIGVVDLLRMGNTPTSDGTLAYELTTAHDALLTVALESGSGDVTLLDAAFQPVATSTSGRVDHRAAQGETYYFFVETTRSRLDLVIANLVDERTADVFVHDTTNDDAFAFSGTETGYVVEIDDVTYALGQGALASVTFDGTPGGDDTADLTSGPDAETATLRPTSAIVMEGARTVATVTDCPTIAYHGVDDDDTAIFLDSGLPADADDFHAAPGEAFLRGTGYENTADGVPTIEAYVTNTSTDRARLLDSSGDDTLNATADRVTIAGDDFSILADGFQYVAAYATGGGSDTATIADSPGDDQVYAYPQQIAIINATTNQRFRGFETVSIASTGGNDTGVIYDSPGDDTLTASPTRTRIVGEDFDVTLQGLRSITAHSTAGGSDQANLTDLTGVDDLFTWDADTATLRDAAGTVYSITAEHFESVTTTASGDAGDTATLATGLGVNRLTAQADWLAIAWSAWERNEASLRINNFENVTADGNVNARNSRTVGAIDYLLAFTGDWL